MEPFLISKVEGTFTLVDRGTVVSPGVPREGLPHSIRSGDIVELRQPGGSIIQTKIAAIEHATLIKGGSQYPIRFPAEIGAEDVPLGTEIWWVSPNAK
jgi:hypothetical protein